MERQSPNPDTALNDIITENYPMLKPTFGQRSRVGDHEIGVSEDSVYHSYFLLLPPADELVLGADDSAVDKFVKKLVKRAQSFHKAFANPDSMPLTAESGAVPAPPITATTLPPPPPPPVVAAAPPVVVAATTTTTTTAAAAVATTAPPPTESVLSKRERDAMEQAAQAAKDQEALIELQKEQRAAKRAREADDLKRKADAELALKREAEERAALAAQAEEARNAAELERLELERLQRAAQCPFPKRPAGAVGFVREPFQTADGLIVNPWFLLH